MSFAGDAAGGDLSSGGTSIHSIVTLPETVTLSARQQLNDRLALLGAFEWTRWSRVQATFAYNDAGVAVDSLPVSFDDGWFFALGSEYKYGPFLDAVANTDVDFVSLGVKYRLSASAPLESVARPMSCHTPETLIAASIEFGA